MRPDRLLAHRRRTERDRLVGGAYNAEREDMLLLYALNDLCMTGSFRPVLGCGSRAGHPLRLHGRFPGAGITRARDGARGEAIAKLSGVWSERAKRDEAGSVAEKVRSLIATAGTGATTALYSGATGAAGATRPRAKRWPTRACRFAWSPTASATASKPSSRRSWALPP